MAKTLGAKIIERHITLDKNMYGNDHRASLTYIELKNLIKELKDIDIILGNGRKEVTPSEVLIRSKLRKY